MNARVVFSKKTQEKINKGLTRKERGELRWKKLEEANEDGRLSLCKTRKDVAALGGYPEGVAGTSWVHNLVRKGYLQEVHVSGGGKFAEYTYFINSKPNFLPFAGRYGSDTFKKEPTKTIEPTKPTKPTNTPSRKVGEKRWETLEEAYKTGRLAECKCRRDLIILAGYTDMVQGRSWVANLIRRGHIEETVVDGVASYRLVKKPNYTYFTRKDKKIMETPKVEEPVVLSNEHTEPMVLSKAKLTIKTDIATVEIESVSAEIVEKVLEKVCATTKM